MKLILTLLFALQSAVTLAAVGLAGDWLPIFMADDDSFTTSIDWSSVGTSEKVRHARFKTEYGKLQTRDTGGAKFSTMISTVKIDCVRRQLSFNGASAIFGQDRRLIDQHDGTPDKFQALIPGSAGEEMFKTLCAGIK